MFGTSSITYSVPETAKYLLEIQKNSIGMDEWFKRFDTAFETHTNYPPYNLVQISNVESRLELALAGFSKKEVLVYTRDGKLFIEGQKEDKETETNYVHKGLAQRSFTRTWTLADDTEVSSVNFEDGLLIVTLGRIVPESHKRKDYL